MKFTEPGNENISDNSLFAAIINPLVLETDDGSVIWRNEFPQSSLFARTFHLEYADETKEYVARYDSNVWS